MNPTKKNTTYAAGDRIDRLVDGELSESERRALLASFDSEPEGWRRCALAFLETQTWRETFGEISHALRKPSNLPTPDISPPSPLKRNKKKPLGAMGTVMAMAASFLVTLGLGSWMLHGPPRGDSLAPSSDLIAGNGGSRLLSPLPTVSAGGGDAIRLPKPPSASTPWQMVKLHAPGLTGDNETLQLPALPRERLDDDFLNAVPNPLPDDVRQALERTGHEVRIRRELVPVQLKDGRQLVVPVDQVDVQYEGHRAY